MSSIRERAHNFLSVLRHCQHLGMQIEQADEQGLIIKLPYSDKIVGNPVTGLIHGGAITTLMDTCCGISTVCYLPTFEICPTRGVAYQEDREQPIAHVVGTFMRMGKAAGQAELGGKVDGGKV